MPTLKGVWVFSDVLSKPTWYEQEANFTYLTSSGTNRNAYRFIYDPSYDNTINAAGFCVRVDDAIIGFYSFAECVWHVYYVSTPFTVDFGSAEQEVSADFYAWLIANATRQKTFKKLYIGDTVASSGARVFKKLTTESEAPKESIVGTWLLNENPVGDVSFTIRGTTAEPLGSFYCRTHWGAASYSKKEMISFGVSTNGYVGMLAGGGSTVWRTTYNNAEMSGWATYCNVRSDGGMAQVNLWAGVPSDKLSLARTVTFAKDTDDPNVIVWLKANAVRQ